MLNETITSTLDKILEENKLGLNFSFRLNQRETVEAICHAYFENPKSTVVISAPTGTGKSIIAIASSLVLSELGKHGYLIASDLSLQDQYENAILDFKLPWGSIKGVDNYTCHVNGLPFSLGDCRLKGMGYERAKELSCWSTCEYLQARQTSIESRVALLNYSFWLIQRNYVDSKKNDDTSSAFTERDFIFFDEAHKVDDIVQNHFSPKLDFTLISKVDTLNVFFRKWSFRLPHVKQNSIELLVNLLLSRKKNDELIVIMKHFISTLSEYLILQDHVKAISKKKYNNAIVPKEWRTAFSIFDNLKDIHCKFEDYVNIITEVGINKMIVDQSKDIVKFTCVDEQWMIRKHLHEQAGFKVFMSATIGDPKSYMKIMGITDAKFIRINNDFNYEKSPIVFVNKFKLSMAHKEKSFPHVLSMMDKILIKHNNHRGIIHTGSYDFTQKILDGSSEHSRFISYTDSKTKAEALSEFKSSNNGILIGPSILEGLDLSDDISRFQIFFKVPYPSLGSPHIKAKMNYSPDWYSWKTSISFAQGVGRSVRNKNDWAITYVLDACFGSLIKTLPNDIQERIKTLK
jgi:Rad3-related DNA helicase